MMVFSSVRTGWSVGRGSPPQPSSPAPVESADNRSPLSQATQKILRTDVSDFPVLWENLTDPIITGREELGFSKIYFALPEPHIFADTATATANWMAFQFMQMELSGLVEGSSKAPKPALEQSDGTLHYKYMPRTGEWGTADAEYAVLTPASGSNSRVIEQWSGSGEVQWNRARWEDLPTQYNIVNGIADLEVREWLGATVTKTIGAKDLSDQRILR